MYNLEKEKYMSASDHFMKTLTKTKIVPLYPKIVVGALFSAAFHFLVQSCVGLRSQTDIHPTDIKIIATLRIRIEALAMFC